MGIIHGDVKPVGERAIDGRSDIYALGAVTYEMLAGEPPFTGPNVQAIVAPARRGTTQPDAPATRGASRTVALPHDGDAYEAFFSANGDKRYFRTARDVVQVPLAVTGDQLTLVSASKYVGEPFADFLKQRMPTGQRRPNVGQALTENRIAVRDSRHDGGP